MRYYNRRGMKCCMRFVLLLYMVAAIITVISTDSEDERTTAQKCSSEQCKIQCNGRDTAGLLADLINEIGYEEPCKVELQVIIRESDFPNNTLSSDWLDVTTSITNLGIINCNLEVINSGAFEGQAFNNLSKLTLQGNNIHIFNKDTFLGLFTLKELNIIENKGVTSIEDSVLENVANTLEILLIQNTLTNADVVKNITGSNEMPRLATVDFGYNSIKELKNDTFIGLSNVRSLYLIGSSISVMDLGALNLPKSLNQLYLTQNKLTSLPEGIFDTIVNMPSFPNVFLYENPWHCSCSFIWFQEFVLENKIIQSVNPTLTCTSPKENANKSIVEAEFCFETTSTIPPTTTEYPDTSPTIPPTTTEYPDTSPTTPPTTTEYPDTSPTIPPTTTEYPDTSPTTPPTTTEYPDTSSTLSPTTPAELTSEATTTESPTSTSETQETTGQPTSTEPPVNTLTCIDYSTAGYANLSSSSIELKPIHAHISRTQSVPVPIRPLSFYTITVNEDWVEINVTEKDTKGYLMWYPTGPLALRSTQNDSGCYKKIESTTKITQLKADQMYFICYQNERDLSCGSIKTLPIYANQAWITYGNTAQFIVPLVVTFIICVIFGLFGVCQLVNDSSSLKKYWNRHSTRHGSLSSSSSSSTMDTKL